LMQLRRQKAISSWLSRPCFTVFPSALGFTQRRPLYEHRVAVVPQAAQRRLHHWAVGRKLSHLVIPQI
jgi:hypothetical protein